MTRFVSYAQNFEDVILWRALRHIKNGFYVDCGAFDPDSDSVTKAFYERGWRGINIEPIPHLLQKFAEQRPLDTNVCVALSDRRGDSRFFEVPETGLSTLVPDVAYRHVNDGFLVRQKHVPTSTLADVLSEHSPETIHFLKIDVEGAEGLVLRGADFEKNRPWVILVEATIPLSSQGSADWEAGLLARGYTFVYFDGLNRFYVADEQIELATLLAIPPNVFDEYIQNSHLEALKVAGRAVDDIKRSTSWRVTAPLRMARKVFDTLRVDPLRSMTRMVRQLAGLRAPALRFHQVKRLYNCAR